MADQPKQIEVPIEWHVPDSITSQYATNMIVQHTEHEFIISFFETIPPFLIGILAEEELKKLDSVQAKCVARVVIARGRMTQFIDALQTNLKTAESKSASSEEE